MFDIILFVALILAIAYIVHLHGSRASLRDSMHATQKLDHDWLLFESRTLGPAVISRIDTLIEATDLRRQEKTSALLNYLIEVEQSAGFNRNKVTHFDYKEAGYHVVRDSGPGGLTGSRIVIYRDPLEEGLLIACYNDFDLKWFFHTTDLPPSIVKNKNKFIDDLYHNWLSYITDKHLIEFLAKRHDVEELNKNAT